MNNSQLTYVDPFPVIWELSVCMHVDVQYDWNGHSTSISSGLISVQCLCCGSGV